jgi:hypothetical protein
MGRDFKSAGRVSRLLAVTARTAVLLLPLVLFASLVNGSEQPVLSQKK